MFEMRKTLNISAGIERTYFDMSANGFESTTYAPLETIIPDAAMNANSDGIITFMQFSTAEIIASFIRTPSEMIIMQYHSIRPAKI